MKVGDLVRRAVENNGKCLHSYVGIIVEDLHPGENEFYETPVFKVFWSAGNTAYAISESKLELLNECR